MPNEISGFLTQAGHKRRPGKLILSYMIVKNGQVSDWEIDETWV